MPRRRRSGAEDAIWYLIRVAIRVVIAVVAAVLIYKIAADAFARLAQP